MINGKQVQHVLTGSKGIQMKQLMVMLLVVLGFLDLSQIRSGEEKQAEKPLEIGDRRELFVDDYLIGSLK
ncbi:MAG TPA: hypothetical protein DDZ90_04140, partial [Planctomycetaceae bacterium]|nr:hypothetical protein [Planctomycetaceae bacterium]